MSIPRMNILDNLTRAGALLTRELNIKSLISVLVEQSIDISSSDLAALYLKVNPEKEKSPLKLTYRRGAYEIPEQVDGFAEHIEFITDCNEAVILLERKENPFKEILLNEEMNSAIALPVSTHTQFLGVLVLNSLVENYYDRTNLMFLDSFVKLAGGLINNAQLYQELRSYVKEIEELKLYQENIFSSMTNLLITTDKDGSLKYFNQAAAEDFNLTKKDLGEDIRSVFKESMNRKILNQINRSQEISSDVLGIEGIFTRKEDAKEIDFSLNISPLKNKSGTSMGSTLLFTDQTRERELQEKMDVVVGERRLIKDMFAKYMSAEVVKTLTDAPELVKPGGDKKLATIFFADIRGYTSFSEGREPEYIISILNEYFSEAVEVVIKNKGYIDKFIGDCIMAAWGVPLQTEQEDAIQAVGCALQIQQLVKSRERKFWKGEAKNLKVGIGMHTGPLVAGNLGSSRRMNYTVIGDTVNVAARLEGVAEPGEVIITQETRKFLGDTFRLKEKSPVHVKGKAQPIQIYNVVDFK